MSLLVPLYLLGIVAVGAPLVFHLIRRTPRTRAPFSTLLFLRPSPPRLTRRSRLDQLLLLFLRGLALTLLALAFARPFLRSGAEASQETLGRRVALLVDTSASMRRGTLWQDAIAEAERLVAGADPADLVALYSFDGSLSAELSFAEAARLGPDRTGTLIRDRLRALAPTWSGSSLGTALADLADALHVDAEDADAIGTQIEVIGDFQQGSDLVRLQTFDWPDAVRVAVHPLAAGRGNVACELLGGDEPDDEGRLRVRLLADAGAGAGPLSLTWKGGASVPPPSASMTYQVPPGSSQIVRAPPRPAAAGFDQLVLEGDGCDFDNVRWVAPEADEPRTLHFVGPDDPADPRGLLFYLRRLFGEEGRRPVEVATWDVGAPLDPLAHPLVIVAPCAEAAVAELLDYVKRGGTLLSVITAGTPEERDAARDLQRRLLDDPGLQLDESEVARSYLMISTVDHGHPLFAAFDDPRFRDFTPIHFWRARRLTPSTGAPVRTLARFENGDPLLVERVLGRGRILAMTSGWQPDDSQLARSTKFPPLLRTMLRLGPLSAPVGRQFSVDEPVPLLAIEGTAPVEVTLPDGQAISLPGTAVRFDAADTPGLYRLRRGDRERVFAVNLGAGESDTSPLDVDELARRGVQLGRHATVAQTQARTRQLHRIELERRQQVWRWLLAAVVALLVLETWLGGHIGRRLAPRPGVPA